MSHASKSHTRHLLQRAIHISVAAIGLSFIATASSAAEAGPSTVVDYSDLNLASHSDSQRLYSRLKEASRNVCRDYESRELARKRAWNACYERTLANAVSSLDQGSVTALHTADRSIRVAQSREQMHPRS